MKPQNVIPAVIVLTAAIVTFIAFKNEFDYRYYILAGGILLVFWAFLMILFYRGKIKIHVTCPHKTWGPVHNGFQYCTECGTAKLEPEFKCKHHIDEIISEIEIPNKNQTAAEKLLDINAVSEIIYVNRCEFCGRIEQVNIKITDNG